jgi:predicted glycosyltransferase involved in capsule biosynthesis
VTTGNSPAEGRNNGVKYSTTDIIAFFDADCYFQNPRTMEISIKRFVNKKLDIASGFAKSNPKNTILGHLAIWGSDIRKIFDFCTFKLFKTVIGGSGWFLVVKKEMFLALNGFDQKLINYEDTEFIKRAVKENYKFGLLPHFVILSGRRYNNVGIKKYFFIGINMFLYKITDLLKIGNPERFLKKYERIKGPLGG